MCSSDLEVGNDDLLLRVQERRQALGGHLPVLILADTQPVPPDWSGTKHVTVMAKPVDPARIQAWLATVRSQ